MTQFSDITVSLEWAVKPETWRPVPYYEGLYEVSSFGRVRSVRRSGAKGGIMKLADRRGYRSVSLTQGNKKRNHSVHSLVLGAFVGCRPPYFQANHLDGKKANNRVWNLEWCSQQENMRHAFEVLGKTQKGEKNGNNKITDREATLLMILKWRCPETTAKEVADIFGVSTNAINSIWNGKRFKHLHQKHHG